MEDLVQSFSYRRKTLGGGKYITCVEAAPHTFDL